jgi:hypothetical protein
MAPQVEKPFLSIRNIARFGSVAFSWTVFFSAVWAISHNGKDAWRFILPLLFVANFAFWFLFRCPACRGLTLSTTGHILGPIRAPIWTPTSCPRCDLDFETRTPWRGDRRELRAAWLKRPDRLERIRRSNLSP